MTDQKHEKAIEEIWAMFRETDKRFKETDKQFKELGKQIGGLGNKFGDFTEGMAFPSMQRILTEQFKMEFVSPRARVRKNGETIELDVLAYANSGIDEIYVVEVKSHLREDHLQEMLKNLERFPRFFPEHKNKALYGIIAAVDVPDEVKKRVLDAGIYLALIRDDTFALDVPKGFKAKRFN